MVSPQTGQSLPTVNRNALNRFATRVAVDCRPPRLLERATHPPVPQGSQSHGTRLVGGVLVSLHRQQPKGLGRVVRKESGPAAPPPRVCACKTTPLPMDCRRLQTSRPDWTLKRVGPARAVTLPYPTVSFCTHSCSTFGSAVPGRRLPHAASTTRKTRERRMKNPPRKERPASSITRAYRAGQLRFPVRYSFLKLTSNSRLTAWVNVSPLSSPVAVTPSPVRRRIVVPVNVNVPSARYVAV